MIFLLFILFLFILYYYYYVLFTSSELCVSSPMLGIIVFVYIQCAVSVIGLVAVDSAHK
jgi:hypothetical protein